MLPFCQALNEQFEVLIAWRPSSFPALPWRITWCPLKDPERVHCCLINMQSRKGSCCNVHSVNEPAKGLRQTLWSRGHYPARCSGPSTATNLAELGDSGSARITSTCRLRSSKANLGGDRVIKSWKLIQHSHFQNPKLVKKKNNKKNDKSKDKQATGQQVAPEEINSTQALL